MVSCKVLCIGSALQDVYLKDRDDFSTVELFDHCLFNRIELGAKIDIDKVFFSVGGGATNAAVTFARQGIETLYMGEIGRDAAGQAVLDLLDEEGIDTRYVKYSGRYGTGYSIILLAPNGERTILVYRGASCKYKLIKSDDISEIKPDWIYLSTLAGDYDALLRVVLTCAKTETKIMFNPGKAELAHVDKLKGLLGDIDVLLLNKEEAQKLVDGTTLDELTTHLLSYTKCVVITDGANGSMASDGVTKVRAGLYEDNKTTDRTGAGDAFGSGFLSQWARGKSLKQSIIFASANSSSVVSQIGAKTGILDKSAKLHAMPIHEDKL